MEETADTNVPLWLGQRSMLAWIVASCREDQMWRVVPALAKRQPPVRGWETQFARPQECVEQSRNTLQEYGSSWVASGCLELTRSHLTHPGAVDGHPVTLQLARCLVKTLPILTLGTVEIYTRDPMDFLSALLFCSLHLSEEWVQGMPRVVLSSAAFGKYILPWGRSEELHPASPSGWLWVCLCL